MEPVTLSEHLSLEPVESPQLQKYRVPGLPPTMYYIPEFISREEEQKILSKIPSNKWLSLSKRRLQAIPSQLTANSTLLAAPLPSWLTEPIIPRLYALNVFAAARHGINHCLVNEYRPGQGIMAHEDGSAYHPVVATVSLSGTLVLDVTGKKLLANTAGDGDASMSQDEMRSWRILQEPRSLLVTTGAAYSDTLHGIAEVEEDVDLRPESVANWGLLGDPNVFEINGGRNLRETRVSLTFRDVNKVSSIGSKLFGKPKT